MFQEFLSSRDEYLERQVLSYCLIMRSIPDNLIPDFFYGDERKIFDLMHSHWREYGQIDIEILRTQYPIAYEKIIDTASYSTDSKVAIAKIRAHWQRREMAFAVLNSMKEIANPGETISKLETELGRIKETGIKNEIDFSTSIQNVLSNIERGMLRGEEMPGFSTSIRWLNNVLGGIEKKKFYVIGGLKKSGKSRFMIFLAIQATENGAGVMIDSLEMSAEQLLSCAFAYYSRVNSRDIGRKIAQSQCNSLAHAAGVVNNLNWSICREKTIEDLRGYIQFQKQSRTVDIVFVDFIQRMNSDRYKNDRVREVEHISKGLADISREQDVAIVALSQLSKDAERIDGIPDMSCLKESQGIAENADTIIMMHNPDRKTKDRPIEYVPQKFYLLIEQRYDVSGYVVPLEADLRTCIFKEGLPDG